MDPRWTLVEAYFRHVSLTQQTLDSFDDFIARVAPDVIDRYPSVCVGDHTFTFSSFEMKEPSIVEKDGDVCVCIPDDARVRSYTYSAPFYAKLVYKKTGAPREVHNCFLGRMPIMVRSTHCNTQTLGTDAECENDPGGYFIINGQEKTVIAQERVAPNTILCWKDHGVPTAVIHSCSNPHRHTYVPLTMTFNAMSGRVQVAFGDTKTDIGTFMRRLGSDRAFDHDNWPLWAAEATDQPFELKFVYPHCDSPELKRQTAELQLSTLLRCLRGERPYDERDAMRNKRLDTAGSLLGVLFSTLWAKYMADLKKDLTKLVGENRTINVTRLTQTAHITSGLKYALATGNWRVKGTTMRGKVGVSQALNRNTYVSCISQLRRFDSSVSSDQKLVEPRLLRGDVWGFVCPSETPEGAPVGLVSQLALSARISAHTDADEYRAYIDARLVDAGTPAYWNGALVGFLEDPEECRQWGRHMRSTRMLSPDVSFSLNSDGYFFWCDSGRVYRPIIPRDAELTDELIGDVQGRHTNWDALYSLGVIENVDPYETEMLQIALEHDALDVHHTHVELHPSLILGTVPSTIPFPDHNQAPRNTYQAAMGKQAMGVYATSYQHRYDTTGYILHYPQKPLVAPRANATLGIDMLPSGINAVIAIMCFGGFNQEDSILVNRRYIDLGGSDATVYRTYAGYVGSSTGYTLGKPKPDKQRYARDYSILDDDGLPSRGSRVAKGMVIIGRVGADGHDASIVYKKNDAIIDDVIIFDNQEGGRTVKVKVRERCRPELGDKHSSRHGQKGTIGMIYSPEDFPFTADGMSPDIIINPHAIPSRMTIGHMFESLCGIYACVIGNRVDATPFAHKSVEQISDELRKFNLDPHGNTRLYHPHTGKPIEGRVFMGPTYYQRLKHMVRDKMHARPRGKVVGLTRQPNHGRAAGGGLRWGEMERDCGIAHGAPNVLRERMLLSSDAYETPVCACGTIGCECGTVENVTMPYPSKLLFQELMSMGVRVNIRTSV